MFGKKISPVVFAAAMMLIILNCGGIIFLNKVYNIKYFHITIFIFIQFILAFFITAFFNYSRKSITSEKELLKLCGFDLHDENPDSSAYDVIRNKIISYRKKITDSSEAENFYKERNLKLIGELEIIIAEMNSRKESAEKLRQFRNQIIELAETVKELERNYKSYDSSISSVVEEQAESAENLNRIIGNLIESIEQEAVIASKAEDISSRMTDTVKSGGDDISKTIALITAVEQLSGQISEIIAVIDNITELTNLLAMNAAIEAAHAGDAGRGFAVVAGEIQKLSKETSKSSGKISDLVKTVSATIKDMTSNAENASEGLKAIMESVNRTGDIVKDITGAIMQQSEESNRVLSASSSIIETAEKMTSDRGQIRSFPEIIEKIEGYSSVFDSGIESVIDDLQKSEGKIRELISINK